MHAGAECADLPRRSLLAYSLAALPTGFTFVLANIYLLKFCTDVLGIAPDVMFWLYLGTRVWDWVVDPLVGLLSDRTESRFGRRRPWLALGALPMAAGFAMMFGPPATLGPAALDVWMAVALLAYFTGVTMIEVPHSALGAELSPAYRDRMRVFAFKRALFGVGALCALLALGWLEGSAEPRATGRAIAGLGACLTLALVPLTAAIVRERGELAALAAHTPSRLVRDVLRNPHARLLLAVFALQQIGVTALSASLPFLSEYVLGTAPWTAVYLQALFIASLVGVPLWVSTAARIGKRTALRASMIAVLIAIASLCAAVPGQPAFVIALAMLGGLASAGMDVLGPSLQADVIDWDELHTRERKEGAYFAAWAFAQKTATAVALGLTSLALQAIGFEPNAEQTDTVRHGLRALTALVPALFFGAGLLCFWRFTLTAEEHAQIRREISARG